MKLMSLTRAAASDELFNRGWHRASYPGVWKHPLTKQPVVWFVALQREGISFNKKDKPFKDKQLKFKFTYGNTK